jgi:hypothetical protein
VGNDAIGVIELSTREKINWDSCGIAIFRRDGTNLVGVNGQSQRHRTVEPSESQSCYLVSCARPSPDAARVQTFLRPPAS